MLTRSSERELLHKYWIRANEKLCLKKMNGGCDLLGQDPNKYPDSMKVVAVYELLYPLIVLALWTFYAAEFTFSVLVTVFSGIFIPALPLVVGFHIIAFSIVVCVGIAIEIGYLYYLFKRIGVYASIPAIAFLFQMLLSLIPFAGSLISVLIGLLPWGMLALGAHYIHYQVGIGIVFNADDSCYIYHTKKEKVFSLDW